ncbi:hypothetical protein Taro_039578 [Colocasia esculenta]|uniref:Uncharacterized protein n=1 Tax=Colocasia esculenta TaxID=4460 RepID=A0A843WMN0_COLES|nr:hypothetical protein [Colocasia esculenta]
MVQRRSRQSFMKITTDRSVRQPERDRVPYRDQIVTSTCVTMALRTRPIRPSRSQRTGVVGDVAPLEETVETDSERGD